ncbi:serine/threonine-protein kinase OXI1-like [Olea europaea var. sylvestris]|uniref:non-specific serine/threonine protein kinase n=1 Tax=Olea europaea subsp. europaea TaxID=158383 RepID=A0A8S0QCK5_OLEEU|nr:serine/threonine-protein kinase OXI1-like [Olea europaea var. sylvestris]CAA2965098.1 serine threonine- kinase OXI1-like [Olea europaea subsp. europaea]
MHDGGHHHEDREMLSLDLQNLKVISALGRGAKGVVFLVRTEKGELLALKAILRSSVEKKKVTSNINPNEYRRICFEREVLSSLHHPLLPKLKGVLLTEKIVGYAIDYCPGRDLHSLRKKQTEKMFSDDIIRFYAAELVLALEYLHGLGIVYRDLKPENVMIQENGHLMLVDFDLSTKLSAKSPEIRSESKLKSSPKSEPGKKKKKMISHLLKFRDSGISPADSVHQNESGGDTVDTESDSVEKSNSFVGTEDYVAPEIILGNGHDFAVDWWCLGVMLYEMLYGKTPFRGENRKETFYRILSKPPDLTGEITPLRDLIGKLLEKDPRKRISVNEIKNHDFLKAVDWDFILEMPRPPFIPLWPAIDDMDGNEVIDVESYVQGVFEVGEEENIERNKNSENKNKDVWVEGINHPAQIQNNEFLIF